MKRQKVLVVMVCAILVLLGGALALLVRSKLRQPTERGETVLAQVGRRIEPERLRSWALPYLTDEAAGGPAIPWLPELRDCGVPFVRNPEPLVDVFSGHRFLALQLGRWPPYEAVWVGATNAVVATKGVVVKWREGIYYVRKD
jgi:hypothetical protein